MLAVTVNEIITHLILTRALQRSPIYSISKRSEALAGVAQWIEHRPANQLVNQLVTGSVPSHGTCLPWHLPARSPVGGA